MLGCQVPQPRLRKGNVGIEASRQALNLVASIASALSKGWSYTTIARYLDNWVQGQCNERLELAAQTILSFSSFDELDARAHPYAGASAIAVQAAIYRGVGQHVADTVSYELRKHFAHVTRGLKSHEATKPGPKAPMAQRMSMSEQAAAEIAAMSSEDPPVR